MDALIDIDVSVEGDVCGSGTIRRWSESERWKEIRSIGLSPDGFHTRGRYLVDDHLQSPQVITSQEDQNPEQWSVDEDTAYRSYDIRPYWNF